MYQVCLNTETRGCESTGTSTWTPMYVGKFFQIHLLMLELALVCIFVSMSICSSWGSHWTRNVKWHKAVRLAGTRTRSSPWENHTRREARWWYYRVVGMVWERTWTEKLVMVDQIESNTGQKKTCSSLQETWDWDGGSTEQDNPTCTAKATQENQKKKKTLNVFESKSRLWIRLRIAVARTITQSSSSRRPQLRVNTYATNECLILCLTFVWQ